MNLEQGDRLIGALEHCQGVRFEVVPAEELFDLRDVLTR
jgi:hypothetical protein